MFRRIVSLSLVTVILMESTEVIVFYPLVFFVPGDLTPLPTIRARVRRWLFEYHLSEVMGLDGSSEVFEIGNYDAYAGDGGKEGDWDFSDFTCSLELGHRASKRVDHDQHQEYVLLLTSLFPRLLSILFVCLCVALPHYLIFV